MTFSAAGMETALRNRLTFGPLMLLGLFALLWLDHAIEQWTVGLSPRQGGPYGIGGAGLAALLLIILPLATVELASLLAATQLRPYSSIAAAGSVALVAHAFLTQFHWFHAIAASSLALIIILVMLLAALRHAWRHRTDGAIARMAATVLATIYLGGLAWFLLALRVKHACPVEHEPGSTSVSTGSLAMTAATGFHGSTLIILMILLVVKFADISAYFGGRAFGRHKLIPWLSPGKTWEGLLCGLLAAGAVGALFSIWLQMPPWKAFVFGLIIGGIGQTGDLLESLIKRDADVKDSSRLIPGFGGILDIIDSPLLAAPFAYLLFTLL